MEFDDSTCLGLGIQGALPQSDDHDHQKKNGKKLILKDDQLLPSLTLGRRSENTLKSATKEKESTDVLQQASCMSMSMSALSSISNSKGIRDHHEDEGGSPRKKLRLTKPQFATLEDTFKEHSTLSPQKQGLAEKLNLRPRQVEVWFQNRRARSKLKQTEVECELLKRCCEKLKDENKRLQREVQELKSMKLSGAPLYMKLPAPTLTVCPSCDEKLDGGDGRDVDGDGYGDGDGSSTSRSSFTFGSKHLYNSFTHPSAFC
ncbi:homeobox-leucine zipper protein HAT9 [Citrus sinensis]|uniref:Homeobox-leucine zipper protein HAT9 n=1 Tax=Citrus sinensis TaxID=2711 RepID=A0ACB8KNM1_CITSI|nr:homeobox-leucine zipper protein HAT9 [Citrus sinensis]